MEKADTLTEKSFFIRHRYWIIAFSALLFLPPLSFVFQFTGDSNFCGTWCPRMFFVWRRGMPVGAFFASFLRSYMGVALLFGILISTFFYSRYWCSHLCPIGGIMELGSRLVPRFIKINFSKIPAPYFRYGYLSVYLIAAAVDIGSLCCSYCNFAAVPRMFGALVSPADMTYFLRKAGLINLGLVVFLGFMSRGGRAYCNLICPVGALDALSNRLGNRWGKRVRISAEICDDCGQCVDNCPVWAIETGEKTKIDPHSCIPCRICEISCHKNAIVYE